MCELLKLARAVVATLPEAESSCSTDALVGGTGSTRAAVLGVLLDLVQTKS